MAFTRVQRFWMGCRPYQLWRYAVLNLKILRGVDRSKRLPRFVTKYKTSYLVPGTETPGAIANSARPPQVGDVVHLPCGDVRVESVREVSRPRGEFCFLEAVCRARPPSG